MPSDPKGCTGGQLTIHPDEKKFAFELCEKRAEDLELGEVVFVPSWENKNTADNIIRIMNILPQNEYQSWTVSMIQKCGFVVKQKLEKGTVFFPVNRKRLNNKVLNEIHRTVISTGKILQVQDAGN